MVANHNHSNQDYLTKAMVTLPQFTLCHFQFRLVINVSETTPPTLTNEHKHRHIGAHDSLKTSVISHVP